MTWETLPRAASHHSCRCCSTGSGLLQLLPGGASISAHTRQLHLLLCCDFTNSPLWAWAPLPVLHPLCLSSSKTHWQKKVESCYPLKPQWACAEAGTHRLLLWPMTPHRYSWRRGWLVTAKGTAAGSWHGHIVQETIPNLSKTNPTQ